MQFCGNNDNLLIMSTVGLATYSSDERFHVEHTRHRGVWDLRIKSVRKDDEGIYECNLSLHPPESIFISVSVVGKFHVVLTTPPPCHAMPYIFLVEYST